MDQFGISHAALRRDEVAARSAAVDASGNGPAATSDAGRVIHRYGRIDLAVAGTDSGPDTADLMSTATTPDDLTTTEQLGLAAARRRETPEYLAAKASRPRRGEAWDLPGCVTAHPAARLAGAPASPGNDYMEGPIAVGIVIVAGPTADLAFSDAEVLNVVTEVQNGLSFYANRNPLAGISFSYDIQNVTLNIPADPSLTPAQMEPYWRDPAMQAIGYGTGGAAIDAYVNALRENAGTKWSYIAYFTKYPVQWFAYTAAINGGYLVMDYYNDGWGPSNIDTVFAHETGHVFGCPDEYAGQGTSNATWVSTRFGIHNANCVTVATDGGVPCLMKNNDFLMCDYTPAHLGWEANLVVHNFGQNAGSWQVDKHPRLVADLDHNGQADIVGFGDDGIWVSKATGSGRYAPARFVAADFAYNSGWRVDRHPRFIADVAGNQSPGIVGFGDDGVWYSPGNGDGTFGAAGFVIADLGYNQGWRVETHARMLADVTGDGTADIIACGDAGIWTALSTGTGFAGANYVSADFGTNTGWQAGKHPRLAADVTGDGKADVVGFGDDGVWVAVSNGDGSFKGATFVLADLGYNQGWRVENHLRFLTNLGGRSTADIVAFGDAGVYVARCNGDGTFAAPVLAVADFGYNQGWRVDEHPRFLADTTGDGLLDIVGCGAAGVYISRQHTDGTFEPSWLAMTNFGYDAGGWRVDQHPRFVADTDGNGRADLIGCADSGVYIGKL